MYWDSQRQVWRSDEGMTSFQKCIVALVTTLLVLTVLFVLIRSQFPCAIPLGNEEQFVCALQREAQ